MQHLPVALVRATFRLRLKFSVEFEKGSVGETLTLTLILSMASEHAPQGRQNPRLPINQSAVAVKADGGES
jgi:hypothetical protein